jgi:hypothetical protein
MLCRSIPTLPLEIKKHSLSFYAFILMRKQRKAMPTTFNLSTCHELLKTNPKTFHRWLHKAGIQPQENPADPRELLVMKADVITLAQQHNRKLPDWFHKEDTEPQVPISLEGVVEQVVTFEQQTIQRFDQVDRVLDQIETLLLENASKQHELPAKPDVLPTLQQITSRFDQIEQSLLQLTTLVQYIVSSQHKKTQVAPSIVTHEPISHEADQVQQVYTAPTLLDLSSRASQERSEHLSSSRGGKVQPHSTRRKKTPRGRSLPRTMIPLRVFAEQHHISLKVAETASKHGKLTIQQGKWLYQSRYVTKALRAQGQQEFYEYFHTYEGFAPCERCPHGSSQRE